MLLALKIKSKLLIWATKGFNCELFKLAKTFRHFDFISSSRLVPAGTANMFFGSSAAVRYFT